MTRYDRQVDNLIGLKFRSGRNKFTVIKKIFQSGFYMIRTADNIYEYKTTKEVIEINHEIYGGWKE